MRRNRFGVPVLLAGLLVGMAGCDGTNLFSNEPLGAGEESGVSAGTLRGRVTSGGAGVGGATVVVANGPSATTDATGEYRIAGLASGRYAVSLQVPTGFVLAPGEQATRSTTVGGGQVAVASWTLTPAAGAGAGR